MPILHKIIEITTRKKYIEIFEKRGCEIFYDISQKRKIPHVKIDQALLIELFPNKQNIHIECECDECHKKKKKQICAIKYWDDNILLCNDCARKRRYNDKEFVAKMVEKMKNTNRKRYKKDFASQTEETKNKMKKTCLKRYDAEWAAQNPRIVQKQKDTCIERYGTEWASQNKKIKEKGRNSQIEKYGRLYSQTEEFRERVKEKSRKHYNTDHPLSSEIVKQKRYATNVDRYGAPNPLQNEQVKQKQRKTMYENGTCPSSKQQRHICNLLCGELNYPFYFSLDIALVGDKIDVEYDGGGHGLAVRLSKGAYTKENFEKDEQKRYFTLKNNGWKIIRLIAPHDKLLPDQTIIDVINKSKEYLNQNHHSIKIFMEENKVICSQFETTIDEFLNMNFKEENYEKIM